MDLDKIPGWLTVGVDPGFAWPNRERAVLFRGREYLIIPHSEKCAPMIRVRTDAEFTRADAQRGVLELLSALAWAEQGRAVATDTTWCTAPMNIGRATGASRITGAIHFDYLPEMNDPKSKLALALYREGLSANMTPYQFLGFFKVINIINHHGNDQMQWIKDNLQHVADEQVLARIAAIQVTDPDVAKYLYISGRCAVAHAFDQAKIVNPDDPTDLIRLSEDLPVIRELARIAIEREFGVQSKRAYHAEHLYELAGFRALFGEALVKRIKAGEEFSGDEIPLPDSLSLRLRDQDRIEVCESMSATVVWVRMGCVCVRLESKCRRMEVFVGLHFAKETLIAEPRENVRCHEDDSPESARMMLQWAILQRGWFGGNGVVELWDDSEHLLGHAQSYMPPVNSRFPHEEFEAMEAELRRRAAQ